jgi:hypothetical protein
MMSIRDRDLPPMAAPTAEGRILARTHASAFAFNAVFIVICFLLLAAGFLAGQLVQQMQIDERRWQAEQRV